MKKVFTPLFIIFFSCQLTAAVDGSAHRDFSNLHIYDLYREFSVHEKLYIFLDVWGPEMREEISRAVAELRKRVEIKRAGPSAFKREVALQKDDAKDVSPYRVSQVMTELITTLLCNEKTRHALTDFFGLALYKFGRLENYEISRGAMCELRKAGLIGDDSEWWVSRGRGNLFVEIVNAVVDSVEVEIRSDDTVVIASITFIEPIQRMVDKAILASKLRSCYKSSGGSFHY